MTHPAEPSTGAWSGDGHRLALRVYYEDTDFTGVVYYANYLKFFERGRTEALRSAGIGHAELFRADPPLGFAVRRITVDYIQPARIDDALTVETRFHVATGARLSIRQVISRAGTELARAEVEVACIDMDGRPRRLPADVAAALAGRLSRP